MYRQHSTKPACSSRRPGGHHKSWALKIGNLGGGIWTSLGHRIWRFEPIFPEFPKDRRTFYWLWVILDFQRAYNTILCCKCYENEG